MITLYHLNDSRSERIVWLLEELGLQYKLVLFQREPGGAAPKPMKEIHALGRAPIIRDGDTLLAESGAIVEYIVQRHGAGRLCLPAHAPAYSRYIYWMHFAEGSLMSLLLIALVLSRVPEAAASPVKQRIDGRVKQMLAFVDAQLAGHAYFAGDEFTAADVMMVFPFTTMRRYLEYDISPFSNILAYLQRVESRPAYQRAMKKAYP